MNALKGNYNLPNNIFFKGSKMGATVESQKHAGKCWEAIFEMYTPKTKSNTIVCFSVEVGLVGYSIRLQNGLCISCLQYSDYHT